MSACGGSTHTISVVMNACSRVFAGPWKPAVASHGPGSPLLTDRRLVFIAADEASYLPYSAIERVGRGKSLLGAYVSLHTRGHVVRVKWINSRRVRHIVRAERAAGPEPGPTTLALAGALILVRA